MQKFETLREPLLGFYQWWRQENKEVRNNTKNSGKPKFAPLVARTSLGPIFEYSLISLAYLIKSNTCLLHCLLSHSHTKPSYVIVDWHTEDDRKIPGSKPSYFCVPWLWPLWWNHPAGDGAYDRSTSRNCVDCAWGTRKTIPRTNESSLAEQSP